MAASPEDAARQDDVWPGEAPPRRSLGRRLEALPVAGNLTRTARVRAKQVVRKQVPTGARHAFRVDMTAMFLAGLYTGAVFPFVNVIAVHQLHAGPQILAIMAAAPFFGNLMALFWARAMDGKQKVPYVKWSQLTARLCILLSLLAVRAWPFALVISAAQIIGTVATPAYAAIIKDVYPDEQRGRILSMSRAATFIAQVFSTLLVGALLGYISFRYGYGLGYRFVFPVAGLIGIAAAVVFSRIQPERGSPAAEAAASEPAQDVAPVSTSPVQKVRDTAAFIFSTLGILKTDHAYRWFALSVFTYGFGNLLNTPIIPLIQVKELHVSEWQISVLTVMMQLVMTGAFFYWGRFVDLRSPQLAVVVNILINALIPVFYILAGTVLPASPWMLLPAYFLSGIVGAGIDLSYFSALLTFAGEKDVSRYQALQSFLLGIRGSIAPFIGGGMVTLFRAHHLNLRWAFALSLVFILTGAWMQVVAMRRQARLLAAGGAA